MKGMPKPGLPPRPKSKDYDHRTDEDSNQYDQNAADVLGAYLSANRKRFTLEDIFKNLKDVDIRYDRLVVVKTIALVLRSKIIYVLEGYGRGKQTFVYGFTAHLPEGVQPPTVGERRRKVKVNLSRPVFASAVEALDAIELIIKDFKKTYAKD